MKIKHLAYSALSASILLCASQSVQAAGFYIQEQSVKGLGSAFSGSTTSIDDASTVYFNPAGMTKLDGMQINAGVHLLIPHGDVDDNGSTLDTTALGGGLAAVGGADNGNPYSPTPIPNLFAAAPITLGNDVIWAGIGITAPFGLASDYGDDSVFRFDSTETELKTINVAPSLAYSINDLISIGGGIDIQYADAELKSAARGLTEGTSTLKGDDITVGYNIGLLLHPTERTDIGLHYRSGISHTLDGRITVAGTTNADFDVSGTADLNLPDIATLGLAHDVTDRLRVMGQATWFGWSNFEEIRARNDAGGTISNVRQDYQDTYAVAVGVEYDLSDQWTVRGGYQFDATPTTDEFRTTRTPDGDRNWFSAGASYNYNDKLSFDLAGTYINVDEETINLNRNVPAIPAVVNGNTDGNVVIMSLGLNYKF